MVTMASPPMRQVDYPPQIEVVITDSPDRGLLLTERYGLIQT